MQLILIAGKKGSGKSTLSEYIKQKTNGWAYKFSLADKLKYITFDILKLCNIHIESLDDLYNGQKEHYRRYLQVIGTEIIQNAFGKTIWCELVSKQIDEITRYHTTPIIVIDDIRFQHEIDYFKNMYKNTTVVQIINENIFHNDTHSSENQTLTNIDYVIKNNEEIEQFYHNFDKLGLI